MVVVKTDPDCKHRWRVIGKSVRGAWHERAGLPNQDAISWLPESGRGLPVTLAVSDGHGSAKNFRSDTGARLAVNTVITEIIQLWENAAKLSNLSAVKHLVNEKLPLTLVRSWRLAVNEHIRENPLDNAELSLLEKREGAAARRAVENDPVLAYGATLMAVFVTASFVIYLQLGDGDILAVSETGKVYRPVPGDTQLFANETTSLCSADAWLNFRITFQAISGSPPALILMSTDGYANSFCNEEEFLKVGPDLMAMLRTEGLDKIYDSLEAWLFETSRAGSGDDITLGILCRTDSLDAGETWQEETNERSTPSKIM